MVLHEHVTEAAVAVRRGAWEQEPRVGFDFPDDALLAGPGEPRAWTRGRATSQALPTVVRA
ncbi:hypothetical protein [Myxococcus qinghaiensis]|uniref:hypothetical protein n=1 Tax=Myxococcus qinghaiensis TaxID=2906758 RepID=UPI0020A77779|nr:hypothetical protein [Myxococcus qinghaiensis]MCP3162718.1 hypothetical protein [Myxococcus qinghaiensis]